MWHQFPSTDTNDDADNDGIDGENRKSKVGDNDSKSLKKAVKEGVPVEEFVSPPALCPPKPPDGGWGWFIVLGTKQRLLIT